MFTVAIVGFGFMGRMHCASWRRLPGVRIAAVCDRDLAQLHRTDSGNVKGAEGAADLRGVEVFDDFSRLLERKDIDAIDITLPTPLHREFTVRALNAGFHVMCEKPMAVTSRDCKAMINAAKKHGRLLFIAQCLRFWPEYETLKKLVEDGKFGKVVSADFSRFAAAPGWKNRNKNGRSWFLDESSSGGMPFDLHIHDADVVNWLFGLPARVRCRTHRAEPGFIDHLSADYFYPDGKLVRAAASWAASPSWLFGAAFTVIFERATAVFDSRAEKTLTVYPAKGRSFSPALPKGSGYDRECACFRDLVTGRRKNAPLSANDAMASVHLVETELKNAVHAK